MIATLLAMLASQALPAQAVVGRSAVSLDGRCEYTEAVARFHRETVLVTCDSLTIDRDGGTATLDFRQRSWGSMLRFTGEMSGRRMAVEAVRLRSGESVEAKGTCEMFYSGGKLSVVSCLAKAGSQSYAANFIPTRL